MVNNEEEYVVEEILDSRISRRRVEYLVKWKGYNASHNQWIAHYNLHAKTLVRKFHRDNPDKPNPN